MGCNVCWYKRSDSADIDARILPKFCERFAFEITDTYFEKRKALVYINRSTDRHHQFQVRKRREESKSWNLNGQVTHAARLRVTSKLAPDVCLEVLTHC